MPGNADVWNRVQNSTRSAGIAARLASPLTSLRATLRTRDADRRDASGAHLDTETRRRRRRLLSVVAGLVAVTVLAGGSVAYAQAHKSVTLDVDGEVTELSTFAGSVDALLEDAGVEVGARDDVAPAPDASLADGTEVVVRHAHRITVLADGTEQAVWTTALTADEALATLEARAADVRLVASRSAAGGRPHLGLELTPGEAAQVVVDGTTLPLRSGALDVADALAQVGVELGDLDRVAVHRGADGVVTVLVNRVVIQDVTEQVAVAFSTQTQKDTSRYTDQKTVLTRGVAGARTVVTRVTTVDGVESSREVLSDTVTTAPVDEVIRVGTKKRPVAPAGPITAGGSADSLNWPALAKCESGGRPTAVSSNGLYYGLYQFSLGTWRGVGGSGLPSQATPEEQTARAKMLYNRSGAGQWPHCGPRLFS